ncbi:MAG: TonB-dependent receptor [Desulfobacterales bacterium]|nr:TonB-dependent receptor [Desulfobacterales bacterium]
MGSTGGDAAVKLLSHPLPVPKLRFHRFNSRALGHSFLGGLRYDWEEKELHHHTQNLTLSDTYEQISPKIALKYRFTDTVMT